MLRRYTAALFNSARQTSHLCLKQCGGKKPGTTPEEKLTTTVKAIGPKNMLRLTLAPPEFKSMMFPRIFNLSPDKLPTLHNIIQQADDFHALIDKLPLKQTKLLVNALCTNMASLQELIQPLTGKNQRQILNFIGLKRLVTLSKADSHLSKESHELEFFMMSESLNVVLKRKNHNYLYSMKERDAAKIAAHAPTR